MNPASGALPWQLAMPRGQVRAGRVALICEMTLLHGRVWVTQEGRAEDYWLEPGAKMVLLPGALVVIEADHLSALRIEPVPLLTARAWLRLCGASMRGLSAALCGGMRGNASALFNGGEGR